MSSKIEELDKKIKTTEALIAAKEIRARYTAIIGNLKIERLKLDNKIIMITLDLKEVEETINFYKQTGLCPLGDNA